jgi:hypothetical protein
MWLWFEQLQETIRLDWPPSPARMSQITEIWRSKLKNAMELSLKLLSPLPNSSRQSLSLSRQAKRRKMYLINLPSAFFIPQE